MKTIKMTLGLFFLLLLVSCKNDLIKVNTLENSFEVLDVVLEVFDIKDDLVDVLYSDEETIYLTFKSVVGDEVLEKTVMALLEKLQENDMFYHKSQSTISNSNEATDYSQFELFNDDITLMVAHVGNRDMYPTDLEDVRKRRKQQDIIVYIKTNRSYKLYY